MKKIFIINGGQTFAHSGGTFNKTITNWTKEVLENENFEIRISNVNDEFDAMEEAENFKWADVVVYHFPVWWFQVPNRLKFYIDEFLLRVTTMESIKMTVAPELLQP